MFAHLCSGPSPQFRCSQVIYNDLRSRDLVIGDSASSHGAATFEAWLWFPGPIYGLPVGGEESVYKCLMPGMRSHLVTDHELRDNDQSLLQKHVRRRSTTELNRARNDWPSERSEAGPQDIKRPPLSRYHRLALVHPFLIFSLRLRWDS
jgi:hypothetical protein